MECDWLVISVSTCCIDSLQKLNQLLLVQTNPGNVKLCSAGNSCDWHIQVLNWGALELLLL